ncbi:unnamed protein product [Coffea canephora]|uniref:DH200=94 genomic scaffold, scaffold_1922 n=1 Tax=Coffea canephora TaxID=49390 RepID=A0A068VJ74_COFCA|nr:unnamed protein product [Coffea canephora]
MEKASKKLILFAFFVIASLVIGGPIAKVEASRVQPAEAEAEAEAEAIAEQLITTLESTLTDTGGICPSRCFTDRQCQTRLCRKTSCKYIALLPFKQCV